MNSVRIATLNVENLFARYNFKSNFNPSTDGFLINDLAFNLHDDDAKKITAKLIKLMKADIVCLQEVENMEVLERFVSRYLGGKKYKHRMLIDSHDPRKIDIAVISKFPIVSSKSSRDERNKKNTWWLFSRDCSEVTFDINGKYLTLFNNHFKSMLGGRDKTKERRKEQVDRVAQIISEKYTDSNYEGNFAVLGDFNDYIDSNTSLTSLIEHPGLVNVLNRIDDDDRWTHYWAGGNQYKQIDFILLGKELAANSPDQPVIVRNGLPYRAEKYEGERFSDVGERAPKASDHCGVYIDINLV